MKYRITVEDLNTQFVKRTLILHIDSEGEVFIGNVKNALRQIEKEMLK